MGKKIKMTVSESITFKEGCEMYLDNCRQRNLREGTINHYRQSYVQFYKYFEENMPIEIFTQKLFSKYVLYLKLYVEKLWRVLLHFEVMFFPLLFCFIPFTLASFYSSIKKTEWRLICIYIQDQSV